METVQNEIEYDFGSAWQPEQDTRDRSDDSSNYHSVTGTWLALYRVPWQLSGDPCLVASAATAVVVTCLWLTRWRGLRAANFWLWVEVLGTLIFVALAVLGVKRSPWFLASGMVLHGVAWDTWHYRNSTYMPDWYAIACLAVDLTVGAYVFSRIPAYQKAARIA